LYQRRRPSGPHCRCANQFRSRAQAPKCPLSCPNFQAGGSAGASPSYRATP
jgi:hypothetical protein